MPEKTDRDSPLVTSVLALQNHLNELERLGAKINATDMAGDVDLEYVQKLMTRFAECGHGVSHEVSNLSTHLSAARASAEAIAEQVNRQAEAFNARRHEMSAQFEKFRVLGEKVRELNAGLKNTNQAALESNIPNLQRQLGQLIDELQELRHSAGSSNMRKLEKDAESLAQTLQAVQTKLRGLTTNGGAQ